MGHVIKMIQGNDFMVSLTHHIAAGEPMYIAIEGVIGVGKTTLARMLAPSFGAELLLEVFEENPFLSDFYSDRARYAFQTQIFFLLSRYHQQRRGVTAIIESGKSLLSDYTFAKDSLFARINLQGDELEMYKRVHEALAEKIPMPNLLVYLCADTDVLMQRIALRDRTYERNMERSYIEELNRAYEDFFSRPYDGTPVLTINTNPLDFVHSPDHLSLIEDRIRASLNLPPYQPALIAK
jgi:deoxyguanosine kinase